MGIIIAPPNLMLKWEKNKGETFNIIIYCVLILVTETDINYMFIQINIKWSL